MNRLKFESIQGAVAQFPISTDRHIFSMAGLEEYLKYRRRMSPYTVVTYLKMAKTLVRRYGPITSDYAYATRVEQDLTTAGRSNNTIKNYLHVIEYAVWSTGISRKEYRLSKPKICEKKATYYTLDEVRRLFGACRDTREAAALGILFFTGMRSKEVRELRISDVDLKSRRIFIKDRGHGIKNYHENYIPMAPDLVPILEQWMTSRPQIEDDHLIITRDSRAISAHGLEHLMYRLKARAGITRPGCLHLCRDTTFTMLANSGCPEVLIMLLSGHRSKQSLERYVHPQEGALRQYVDKCLVY
jgi:integrase